MKTISPEFKNHLAQGNTTLTTLLQINRLDGQVFYFTNREEGLTYNLNYYAPYSGYMPSALDTKINMSVDNQSIIGILNSDTITQADIRAGLFDFANVKLSAVNYKDLGMGEMSMLVGKFGEAVLEGNQFTIELRGMAQLLQQKMGELYLIPCPATFGDARCGINALDPAYTKSFTVSAIIVDEERRTFQTNSLVDTTGYFNSGLVTFDGNAANPGVVMDVKVYTLLQTNPPDPIDLSQIELYEPMASNIQIGDSGTILVGCPKSLEACKTKFLQSNHLRYRGFPHLIGATTALRGAG